MRARLLAGLVQAALAHVVSFIIFVALLAFGVPLGMASLLWITSALAFAPLVMAGWAQMRGHVSPALSHYGLTLGGQGCVLCLHIRAWWPFAVVPSSIVLANTTDYAAFAILGILMGLAHGAAGLAALLQGRDPYWTSAAGFTTVSRGA